MDPAIDIFVLERFGIDRFPTRTYIVNLPCLNRADSFLDCTTEVNRTIFKEMCAASKDTDAAEANRTDFSMKTMTDITVITFSIKTLVDQGMTADSQLLTTLDPAAVIFFKNLHHRPANTKKTDLVLTHMPSSTTVNSS